MNLTIEHKVHFTHSCGRQRIRNGDAKKVEPVKRLPRAAKLMALAIRFDELIRSGEVEDQAELARLGYVSRARVTQIMNLLNLAPDIQEALLMLEPVESGHDAIGERSLRKVVREVSWNRQRQAFRTLTV